MLALSGVAALLLSAFVGPHQNIPAVPRPPADANVLRIACSPAMGIDPHWRSFPFPVQNQFILALWEPLIECDPETGQPQPAAAESWEWSPDRKTLVLKLRRDGRWSNGQPVTAADFVRGWRRLLRQEVDRAAALFALKNAEAYHTGQIKDPAEVGVEAMDDFTLRLTLAGVRSTLVTELADPMLAPLHESTEAVLRERSYERDPSGLVTNGAFALERATVEGFRLRPSFHYRGRNGVRLSGLDFVVVDNLKIARLLVAAGRLDMMGPVPGEPAASMPTNRPVREESEMALIVMALDLNVRRAPLRDPRVRHALSLALDRKASIPPEDRERMVPARAWVPDMPGRPGLALLREDADEARRLLAEAGYPGGEGFPVLVMPVSARGRNNSYLQAWTESWYRELGVRTYLAYERDVRARLDSEDADYDVFYNGLIATVPDAGDMLSTFAMPEMYSATHWESPEVRQLLAEADRTTGAERLALLERVERLVIGAMPTIPTLFERRTTLLADEVEGWYADPLGRQSLKRLFIRPGPARPELSL